MAVIRANSESINDRRSVLGFTIRSELPLFEIGLATDPELLRAENRGRRTHNNFYSSQLQRVFAQQRNEAVYLVPPDVMARFIGQPRLYFGLATYRDNERTKPSSVQVPDRGNMYVSLAGLTERGLRRGMRGMEKNGYGSQGSNGLAWGGDAQSSAPQARNGSGNGNGADAAKPANAATAPVTPVAQAAGYSDGFSDDLWQREAAGAPSRARALDAIGEELSDDARGIEGPIPDVDAQPASFAQQARGYGRALDAPAPEDPFAARFVAAHSGNYRAVSGARTIERIVIHITDGGANINGPVSWFQNPQAKVSAHYVIGRDGEIVQMVRHNDVAWHAGSANGNSIGIEHVANTRGLQPTAAQFAASAALVGWLCERYGIPADRQHIQGHAEADSRTSHTQCPNAVWDWDYYMGMLQSRSSYPPPAGSPVTQSLQLRGARAVSLESGAGADADADAAQDEAEQYGHIPEPTEPELATEQGLGARAFTASAPDYPHASRFVPAHTRNYRVGRRRGAVVDRIVIHITAGGPNINGTIGWFQNGDRTDPKTGKRSGPSSSHYIVGRDGEVVQMVRNADTAYHASSANARSIGIEHNANKPYRLNRRDLPPTDSQYEASARLVAWLCAQYGIPADREHIVGHIEASPRDNHDCPSSYWDWDRYMACVAQAVAANAAPVTTQSLRQNPYARAQEIITPFYDPSNPSTALTCQNDAFSLAREEWFVGVESTHAFPHSAICLLEMKDASGNVKSRGTGFYIGPNRILTCAHNLHGKDSVDIVPGNNGRGNEPFGRCNVTSASWRVAPRYAGQGDYDNDLAVIDNVPIAAPNGAWFGFLNATPSDHLPLVVCGYSSRSPAVPELTAAIDGFKQHLHGGYARQMVTQETIDYPILTLKRASGAPVYTLRDSGNGLQALICAVHVSGVRADEGVNTGCFITPAKIDWIEGRATSFALGQASRALEIPLDPGEGGRSIDATSLMPGDMIVTTARLPQSYLIRAGTLSAVSHAMLYAGDGRVIEALGDGVREAPIADALSDAILAVAYRDPRVGPEQASAIVAYARQQVGKPFNYAGIARYANRVMHPLGQRIADKIAQLTGADSQQASSFFCSELIFAAYQAAGVPLVAASADTNAPEAIVELAQHSLQYVGHLLARDEFLGIALGLARGMAATGSRALEGDAGSNYDVPLIAQPRKDAGWAAAMAMLLAFRRGAPVAPDALVRESGGDVDGPWDDEALQRNACARFGFLAAPVPGDASDYHAPRQWARWLREQGPLWVSIAGTPYAVVIAGIRGDLDDAARCEVHVVNPWNLDTVFDQDPVQFHPANTGQRSWMPFAEFAAEFGQMAREDYRNWRVLHLPANAAGANASTPAIATARLLPAPAAVRVQGLGADAGNERSAIEPSRVPGTRMFRVSGQAGACRWSLEQLEGMKSAASRPPGVGSANAIATTLRLDEWPAIDGAATPLPLTLTFASSADGAVGEVRIDPGAPGNATHGVAVEARIDDAADAADGIAVLRVRIDYRFSGLAQAVPDAWIELRLRGDGKYERDNGWHDSPALLSAA